MHPIKPANIPPMPECKEPKQDQAPTIEAEPVRYGYWEESPTGNPNFNYCSVCDGAIQRYDNVTFTYCPHCGARMDGDNDAPD